MNIKKSLVGIALFCVVTMAPASKVSAQNCVEQQSLTVTKYDLGGGSFLAILDLKWESKGWNQKQVVFTGPYGTVSYDATTSGEGTFAVTYSTPITITITATSGGRDGMKFVCFKEVWRSSGFDHRRCKP
ncbi:MAG TPA: hypothetical protein VG982_02960 [Candidatus Paceibacterota bacterium]|jgi:hypothetical protein|nr:hypothetical protein [Candidatus Paceibacterota bacterium]